MKMNKIVTVLLSLAATAAQADAPLHSADAYDIRLAAEFAARKEFIKAGDPVKRVDGYEVPINVKGVSCKVLVKPYTPGPMEPPTRWKAATPHCGK